MSASAARRPTPTRPPSTIGAAIPSPSVTLWTMKPTMRNVPSASSPNANDDADREPLAEVVQADPDRDERREREARRARVAPARRCAAENRVETQVSAR